MPSTTTPLSLARSRMVALLAGAALLAGTTSALGTEREEAPTHFQLAAQTAAATVWSETCTPNFGPRSRAAVRKASLRRMGPQPDPDDVAALRSALRHGDFASAGIRIVETAEGPMLELDRRQPGAPVTLFMICNAKIPTSYD